MFRKYVWRNYVNDAVSWHQDQALNTTIFILKEFGPTCFLLKEDGEPKNFKVCLGDPHTCTCPTFHTERDLCKHICWILMRKFRLPKDHEYGFQLGLVERQILEVLQGLHRTRTPRPTNNLSDELPRPDSAEEDGSVRQKEIGDDDVCPICQEELMSKRLPVTYCRFGCGNNVHISCMKVWADHQTRSDTDAMVKCPLCREDFGPIKMLLEQVINAGKLHSSAERERLDRHLGVICNNCRVCPIIGKCFNIVVVKCDTVPERVVKSLPTARVRRGSRLLEPGMQCRLCLGGFCLGQHVRHLPCHHKFHTDCIDAWLRQSNTCPLDWHVIFNPLTWSATGGKTVPVLAPPTNARTGLMDRQREGLFVPGIGLQDRTARGGRLLSVVSSEVSLGALVPLPLESVTGGIQGLCISSVHLERPCGTSLTELAKVHSGEPKPIQRCHSLGQVTATKKGTGANSNYSYGISAPSMPCVGRGLAAGCVGSGNTPQSLFVGLNHPDCSAHPKTIILPRRIRPLRRVRPRVPRPRPGSGDVETLALLMMGVLINAPHQGKKE